VGDRRWPRVVSSEWRWLDWSPSLAATSAIFRSSRQRSASSASALAYPAVSVCSMSSRLGAFSPEGGASRRVRISSWIMASRQGLRNLAQVSGLDGPYTWAARPIFQPSWAHVLDAVGSGSKNRFRVPRRHLAALLALVALAAPAATPARTNQETPLHLRLARALRVPHV